MINYAFIEDLFKTILTQSNSIEGRFYAGWRYGLQEVNYDNLGQVLDKLNEKKTYPLVIMAPPHSFIHLRSKDENREEFRITLFFCNKSMITQIAPKTKVSLHSVPDDWQDMKRSAINFMRALLNVERNSRPPAFHIKDNQIFFVPFSKIGIDGVSGVKVDFNFKLHVGCTPEDYDEYPDNIDTLITNGEITDSHAEHTF